MSELEEVIKELPPDLHQEVADFARFLMEKRGRKPKGRLKLDWRGSFGRYEGSVHISGAAAQDPGVERKIQRTPWILTFSWSCYLTRRKRMK